MTDDEPDYDVVLDTLEMPLEQFAEAVAKENCRLNEHNEKLKGQTKLYFDAFNKAIARIQKLEAALKPFANLAYENDGEMYERLAHNLEDGSFIRARKALEGKDD